MRFVTTKNPDLRDDMQAIAHASHELRMKERQELAVLLAEEVAVQFGFKKR